MFTTAELARARRSRGLRLNAPEATALIADTVAEAARDGLRLTEAIERGRALLHPDDDPPPSDPARMPPGKVVEVSVPYERRVDATVEVTNESPVPISVSSHFHFFEVNPRLRRRTARCSRSTGGRSREGPQLRLPGSRRVTPSRAAVYGPTAGDLVHLGDTGLMLRVESDAEVRGEELNAIEKCRRR